MNRFIIDGTDFGINAAESFCSVKRDGRGKIIVELSIVGDQASYDRATADSESRWSWTLYPPKFQLYHRVDAAFGEAFEHEYSDDGDDEADVSLYMMEHHFPLHLLVRISSDGSEAVVAGTVDFMSETAALGILFRG